jgi:hypothetical protein
MGVDERRLGSAATGLAVTIAGRRQLVLAAGVVALLTSAFLMWSNLRRVEPVPPVEIEFEPSDPALATLPPPDREKMLDRLQEAEEEQLGVAEAARRRALREQLLEQRTR